MGAHGWVAGIASRGSVLLCRGWLITVEAPGHPKHPPSTQLDAVVNNPNKSNEHLHGDNYFDQNSNKCYLINFDMQSQGIAYLNDCFLLFFFPEYHRRIKGKW